MKRLAFFFLLLFTLPAVAQNDWQEALREWLTAEDMEESYGEELMEQLEELVLQPINLNQTSQEELETLPFLTAQQVEGLIEYLDHYHPIRSLSELQMVSTLDYQTRRLLQYFVVAGDERQPSLWPTMNDLLKDGQHLFTATGKIPFYEREGDRSGYVGYKYRHDVRYQYTYGRRIKAGLTAAQDAGEPFFADKNRWGYDQYHYYVQLRDFGRLEEFNLGHYRVQMGLGLVMNTRFQLGKLATLQTMGRSQHALSAHSSRSANSHLHGLAATVRLSRHWRVTAFASHQAIDATLNSQDEAQTLVTSGYHRTAAEMEKKHNTLETDAGLNMSYRRGGLNIGLTALYTHLNRRLSPQTSTLFRRYYPQGRNFLNASADYGLTLHRLAFRGETAVDQQGHLAFLHSLSLKPADALTVTALHRRYSYRYNSMHGRSFGENSRPQNEQGFFLGVTWQALRPLQLVAYADVASFPWARYQVSAPSSAQDFLAEAIYEPHRNWTIRGRYRLHRKQQDNSQKTALVWHNEHRSRFSIAYKGAQWGTKTQADLAQSVSEEVAKGWMLSQQLDWKGQGWQLSGTAGYFQTDSYDARIYVYERQLADEYAFPMYYGRGFRLAGMAKARVSRWLELSAKMGYTRYNDRKSVGTGLQETGTPWLSDLDLQLSIKL
jgi:hypothetical protein